MANGKEYDLTRNLLNITRAATASGRLFGQKKHFRLNEEELGKDAIAITNDPKFGDNVLQNQIDNFKQAVNGGAKFAKQNAEEPENNPLVYYPKSGNLIFSGSIPQLNNLRFQFSLNDVTHAPYNFVDGLALTDNVISCLSKLYGFYENWCDEWNSSGDLLDKLK